MIQVKLAESASSSDLTREIPVLRAQFFFFFFAVFMPVELHMPSWLIVPDGQKITFSMSIIGKCMSCVAEQTPALPLQSLASDL